MNILAKSHQFILRLGANGFLQENKKDLISLTRVFVVVWLVIGVGVYLNVRLSPELSESESVLNYIYASSGAMIVGALLNLLAMPLCLLYRHRLTQALLIGNFIFIAALVLVLQLTRATDQQIARYEGCLNQLMVLDDRSREVAIESAKGFSDGMGRGRVETRIQECRKQIYYAVSSINNDLYSRINAGEWKSIEDVAAIDQTASVRSFTRSEEDKMVTCLNDLLAGDQSDKNAANLILKGFAEVGMMESPQQAITHCYSNLALAKGRLPQQKKSLAQMIADYKQGLL